MTGMEIVYLVGALGGLGIFIFLIRRASEQSALEGQKGVEKRLRDASLDEQVDAPEDGSTQG